MQALQTLMSCNYNITEALIHLSNNRELQKIMNEQLSKVVSKINDSGDSEIKRDDSEIKIDDSEIKRDELVEEVDIKKEESPSKVSYLYSLLDMQNLEFFVTSKITY